MPTAQLLHPDSNPALYISSGLTLLYVALRDTPLRTPARINANREHTINGRVSELSYRFRPRRHPFWRSYRRLFHP